MPGPERAIWLLLLAGAVVAGLLIGVGRNTDEEPGETQARSDVAAETTARAKPDEEADGPATGGVRSCRAIRIPDDPPEPVTCRTRSAKIRIVGEGDPLLLGGTQVRVLRANLQGQTVTALVRIRNETGEEQGVQGGGQELYLDVEDLRSNALEADEIRIPDGGAETVTLVYELTPTRVQRLQRAGLRAELGVKPWDQKGRKGKMIGVVRIRMEPGPA